jgi:2-methylcitrate dehydratase PrpD
VENINRFARAMGSAQASAQGAAEVIVDGTSNSPYLAAMVNAAASHVAEQDDVHNGSVFHPAEYRKEFANGVSYAWSRATSRL